MSNTNAELTLANLLAWADVGEFAAAAAASPNPHKTHGIVTDFHMSLPAGDATLPNGYRFPSRPMSALQRGVHLLALKRYDGPDPTQCEAFDRARTHAFVEYGEGLTPKAVQRILRDYIRKYPTSLAAVESLPLREVMSGLEKKEPIPGKAALRGFINAVKDYEAFAEEATAAGKTIDDEATRDRSLELQAAMRRCFPDALAAGFRAGQPESQMRSTLNLCIDLCTAYLMHWPHDSDKLLRELTQPLDSLEMLATASGEDAAEKPALAAGTEKSERRKPREAAEPGWAGLGEAKQSVLTALKEADGRLKGPALASKAGYAYDSLRRHFSELQRLDLIDKKKAGYGITPKGNAIFPAQMTV